MRDIGIVAAQVFISALVAGALLPAVVVYAPGLSGSAVGRFLPFLAVAVVFVLLRLAWPRRNQAK